MNIVKAEFVDLIKLRVVFYVKAKCDLKKYSAVDIQRCLDGIRTIKRAKTLHCVNMAFWGKVDSVEECISHLSGIRKLWLKVVNRFGQSDAEFSGQAEALVGNDSQT